jgi:hypothetical protein
MVQKLVSCLEACRIRVRVLQRVRVLIACDYWNYNLSNLHPPHKINSVVCHRRTGNYRWQWKPLAQLPFASSSLHGSLLFPSHFEFPSFLSLVVWRKHLFQDFIPLRVQQPFTAVQRHPNSFQRQYHRKETLLSAGHLHGFLSLTRLSQTRSVQLNITSLVLL